MASLCISISRKCFTTDRKRPVIIGGRFGLSSKDTTPSMVLSVFENMKLKEPKNQFTVGIVDDVTFKSPSYTFLRFMLLCLVHTQPNSTD